MKFALDMLHTSSKSTVKFFALLVVAMVLVIAPFKPVYAGDDPSLDTNPLDNVGASLQDQLTQVEKDIAKLKASQQNLRSQINSQQGAIGVYSGEVGKLRGEMETLQMDIAQFDLQIKELDLNIKLLDEQIALKEKELKDNEVVVEDLETVTNDQIDTDYISYRSRGSTNVEFLPSKDPNSYFKDSQYKNIIQQVRNQSLDELVELKVKMEQDKAALDENRIKMARDKAVIDEQYSQLERAKADLQSKIDGYYSMIYRTQSQIKNAQGTLGVYSEEVAKKQGLAEALRQQIFNSFKSIPAGQYVVRGQQIGDQGSTGWSTGPHLHFAVAMNGAVQNPCNYLPGGFIAGCGGNGTLDAPMRGTFYYTSAFYSGVGSDVRCLPGSGCMAHPAIDIANSIWNAPIYAAHDGWLFKGVDQYGALYVIICQNRSNCNSGLRTGYWHLSRY